MATTQDVALPSWIRIGAKCRWWSESQKTLHPIVITSLDTLKRRVVVHFEADHRVWKTVPFAHLGSSGPLRPLTSNTPEPVAEKQKGSLAAAASAEQNGGKEKEDGTSTPPWYEQIMVAENREYVKDEQRRKEEEMMAQQERKRTALQQEMQKQAEQDRRAREQERRRREETAENERLRILEKLIKEREEEHQWLEEARKMEHEELVSGRVNVVWRQREHVERRQREEEERAEREEEERRKEEKLQEELAARPRVSFGVAVKMCPQKILIPQDGLKASSQDLTEVLPTSASSTKRWDQSQAASMSWPRTGTAPTLESHDTAGMPAEADQGASQSPLELDEQEVPLSASEYYGGLICSIYERHNPTKVHDVPALLDKYAGCELEMYHRICEKYGVDPEPTPSHLARLSPPRSPEPVGYARKASAPPPPRPGGLKRPSPTAVPPQPPSPQQAPTASSLLARFQSLVSTEEEDAMSDPGATSEHDATTHASWGHRGNGVAPGDAQIARRSRGAYVPSSWERGQCQAEHSRNVQNGHSHRLSASSNSRYMLHSEEGIEYRDGGRDQHVYRDHYRDDKRYSGRAGGRREADAHMDHGQSASSWGARYDYDSGYRERSRSHGAACRHRGPQGGNYRGRHRDSRHPHRDHYRSGY